VAYLRCYNIFDSTVTMQGFWRPASERRHTEQVVELDAISQLCPIQH